ncbi:MAG: LptF/LptG family permease [Planctomycetota bacterium]|jgi:lipopolysaccharide export LptBFGC system permease protein LptF|nr:LptF/LptG family permease [Planctomycetota bacterium]
MSPSLLTRRCLLECLRLSSFYLAAYLVLIIIAVAAPLIRSGAPVGDVIAFLPDQIALPGSVALPLALVTGILAALGRMREDGELIALQAAGVSTIRVALAILPLALLTCAAVGYLSHEVQPAAFKRWREGKASLLRQAVATQVARRRFIYNEKGTTLTAREADGDRLLGLFARHRLEDGRTAIMFAPEARWVADTSDPDAGMSLHLELDQARMLLAGDAGAETGAQAVAAFPALVLELAQERADASNKADTKPTSVLHRDARDLAALLAVCNEDSTAVIPSLLRLPLRPLTAADLANRIALRLALINPDGLGAVLEPALVEEWQQGLGNDVTLLVALNALLPQLSDQLGDDAPVPLGLEAYRHDTDAAVRAGLGRIILDEMLGSGIRPSGRTQLASELGTIAHYKGDQTAKLTRQHLQKELRTHQMIWHLRWLLAVIPLAYWLFACGLAFTLPATNRLLALAIGLATVLVTILPGVGLVKGVGGSLGFNPAPVMWGTAAVVALVGAIMLWRRR